MRFALCGCYVVVSFVIVHVLFEPAHDKSYNKMFVIWTGKPVHPPSMTRVLIYPILDSLEAVEGRCDQRGHWSDCAVDLSFHWLHKSYCRFCRALEYLCVVLA